MSPDFRSLPLEFPEFWRIQLPSKFVTALPSNTRLKADADLFGQISDLFAKTN